ncbi:polysaccharide deacetylase family protein [Viridibacillus sp. YIM B01967]|uniref:Polysaccharide deacetylase family protein n=1 Tax=Viridibacillus soli TaxID=2798301 RepID=A0ABS1HA69_9BACL|nr:polysaccharide deacetylase family protein [Viridibacillus soli]MBK3496169.1 polysaccharide deacetylase family protein [Viridibacillus soli]
MKLNHLLILTVCVLTILVFYAGFSNASDKGRRYYEESGQMLWDINTDEKIIALTFDDGPHPRYTEQILDLLTKHKVKATFFVIGENAEKQPELVLREYNEGHELANHTYTHTYNQSVNVLEKELKKTNDLIHKITGFYPVLFRPVGGQYDDNMINVAVKNGYKVVIWSWHQDTEDWKSPGVNKIVKKVLNNTKPGDVILFHDGGGNRTQTIKALDKILPELQKQGYKFVTISELMDSKNE